MIWNKVNRLSHRKSSINKKLGFFIKIYLTRLGKRDGDNGTVRKDLIGYYTSPYIEEAINLCKVQIRKEQEQLENILLPLQSEISNCEKRIVKQNTTIEYINLHKKHEDTNTDDVIDDTIKENPLSNFSNLLEKTQNNTRLAAIEQQKGELKASIEIIKAEIEQINTCIKKEKEITRLRCLQAYDFLIARLSVYWKGVLITASNNSDFLPRFKEENLFAEIQKIINEKM